MRDTFISSLTNIAKSDPSVMLITGDLGFGVLDNFANEFPSQYLNAGVAEQNMTGVAVGMALEGRKVFTYSIGNFPTLRALEQIRNDAAYHDANVTVVAVGGGFSYGALGMSHHATEDLAIMRALPQLRVLSPGCNWEVEQMTSWIMGANGTNYLRLDKSSAGNTKASEELFEYGQMRNLRKGREGAIFATGGILAVGIEVADLLTAEGINISVYSVHSLSHLKNADLLKEYDAVFTLEEHVVTGGLGGLIAETCLETGARPSIFYRFGLRGGFSSIVGSQDYLRKRHGLDSESISSLIKKILNKKNIIS
jgi:transketolase